MADAGVVMRWKGRQSEIFRESAREVCIEGAVRAAKTTICLWREHEACRTQPKIPIMLARWTEDAVFGLIVPLWNRICEQAGDPQVWNSKENCFEWPHTGARIYIRGLKSQDQTLRYCCAPETLVLTSDLRWVRIDSVRPGDELVGCDEYSQSAPQGNGRTDGRRRLRRASVVGVSRFEDARFRVVTDRGEITVNAAHPFLTVSRSRPGRAKTGAKWIETRELKPGDRIKFLSEPWQDKSDSWFAGILDGEGHVALSDRAVVAVAQREGVVLDRIHRIAQEEGLEGRQYAPHANGGRFFEKAVAAILGGDCCLPHKNAAATVLAIEPFGPGPVIGLETTTRTLITNGFVSHNSKFRGLTLARIYIDQAEEMPQDVYVECAGRLSAQGFRHQITISPQAVEETHWIAKEFPPDNPNPQFRKYYSLSVYDNAHNLDPAYVASLERLYPPSHPKYKTLLLGQRGMNVTGEPVYKGAFQRAIHEGGAEYDAALPLEMALDFGKHHPCVVFRQVSPLGQVRFLGGILGQQLYLDDFCDIVLRYRANWFPGATVKECCDPAGTVDTSHGTHGAYKTLHEKGIRCVSKPDANSPAMRLAAVERLAALMRRRAADRQEAFVVSNSDRWLRISEQNTVIDRFLADGFEAGYVWDEHMVSVNNKQVRKPKKDGWYEHGQNCAEYLELNFGQAPTQRKTRESLKLPPMPTHGEMAWGAA